jgi:hypothetical protein
LIIDIIDTPLKGLFRDKNYKHIQTYTLVPEVYFYYFYCEGERKNKPLVESGN